MGEWDVVSPPTRADDWEVASPPTRITVPRRGGAAGGPSTPGSSVNNPVGVGVAVPVNGFGRGPDGSISQRTANGWRVVVQPPTRPRPASPSAAPTGLNGITSRDAARRQAAQARPTEARPDRGFFGWRLEDAIAPGRAAVEALGQDFQDYTARPASGPDLGRFLKERAQDAKTVGDLGSLALSPLTGAINEVTAPIARGMTDLGLANDETNNSTLASALALFAPEKPSVRAPSVMRRFAEVTGDRPTVAVALAAPRNAPLPAVAPAPQPAAPAPVRPPSPAAARRAQVGILRREGIEPTPGQRAGPGLAGAEDKAMSVPIVGDAIGAARLRAREQMNRAVANRALGEIGETLPPEIRPGNDAVAYTQAKIGSVYDSAADLVTAAEVDGPFAAELAAIRKGNADLPETAARDFERILADRLARLSNGPVDGATLKQIQSELRTLAAKRGASADAGERDLGEQLDRVAQAIGGVISRANPQAGEMIAQADRAWMNFATLRRAAASPGAQSGVFSPAQLRGAVRASDKSVGKGATARGDANMFDLANAATEIMNGKVPDSGTAGRMMWASVVGGAVSPFSPVVLKGMATALGVSIPYLLTARKLAGTALQAKSAAQRASALAQLESMAVKAPALRSLIEQIKTAGVPAIGVSEAANNQGQ